MRLLRFSCILLLVLNGLFVQGQVVNTEKLRQSQKKEGWIGKIDLNFGMTSNTIKVIRTNPSLRVEYSKERHRIIFLNNLNLSRASTNFVNDGYSHIRHNLALSPRITWESFVQSQYNEIQLIGLRQLFGSGPRIKFWENDTSRLYGGILYMYEYEQSRKIEGFLQSFVRSHRLSTYLSFGYEFTDLFSIDHISYYQPRLFILKDVRVATETSFNFQLNENLAFSVKFSLWYDGRPPTIIGEEVDPMTPPEIREAVKVIYNLSNSLSFRF